jgi:3-oxoacyl-[acyl-carrier-protein] synthase III
VGSARRVGIPRPTSPAPCGWRPDGHGIQGFGFANPRTGEGVRDLGGGLRATVGFADGRNRLTIEKQPGFAAMAGSWAGEVADKLLADHGLHAGDVDLVVANPLTAAFLDALAARVGVDRERMVEPPGGRVTHTTGLGVALAAVGPAGWLDRGTVLPVSAGSGPVAGAALVR